MTHDAYNFLNSLDISRLEILLGSHPITAPMLAQQDGPKDERVLQRERMAKKRAAERDLTIHIPKEPQRRLDALADGELFLQTYFADVFFEPFTQDRRDMHESIIRAAMYGGDQAIAGSRGEGKTKLAIYTSLYLVIKSLSRFPLVIGKNQRKSENELKTVKEKLQQSQLLYDDFPEICTPFRAVGGWSSRARMQTVGGDFTNIELAADHLIFPTITRDRLPNNWPANIEPVSCGQILGSIGIDGGIRGTNFRDQRPSIAIIDDIEDRQAADSDALIEKNEEIIEQDISGLAASAERVSRVFLCTIQNRKCNAYRFTDPKQKPSWKGKRYRKMIKPPDRFDLVQEYIQKREQRDADDPDARVAFRYWRDNREALEAGCVISNPSSYSKKLHEDGEPLELSAIQSYYNKVADLGEKAVATEIDNDPPETVGPQGNGLTLEMVLSRNNGLANRQLPASTVSVTAAIDLGKYSCHWVITAWFKGGGGCVVDYGVAEVHGTDERMDNEASEPAIYKALLNWRDELLKKKLVDASGEARKVDVIFVDSGTYTNAAYEFVRQVGPPFYCSKGIGNYRNRAQSTDKCKAGDNMHAQYFEAQKIWLFELGTDYWKQWVHERFMSPTFDDSNMLRSGAMSIYDSGTKKHLSFAKHIVAEELVTEFKEGKGAKTYWHVHNVNNHWLDAVYNASAAARFTGVALLSDSSLPKVAPREVQEEKAKPKPSVQHGKRFKTRPGGWVNSIRRG